MRKEKLFYFLFLLSFILIIFYAFYSKNFEYILDTTVSIILLSVLFFYYQDFYLNKIIFILIFISLLLHDLGVFGFYNKSPLFFQYDHLTHFVGGFSLSILFVNLFNNLKTNKNLLFLLALLTALGVGSIIEMSEYVGYLTLGEGEGFFYFGGTGDVNYDSIGGAWINSSVDQIFNLFGGIFGLLIYALIKKFFL